MEDFFKYLTTSQEDEKWGLSLTVAGKSEIPKNSEYPLPEQKHPNGYNFSWEKGRILHEYQIHYITEGYGVLETKYGRFKLRSGCIMITYPGEWHRFKPLKKTGWIENYIGFTGEMANKIFKNKLFSIEKPIINCEMREELIDVYFKVFNLVKEAKPCFQFIASGMIINLLGYTASFQKQQNFQGKHIKSVIDEVRFMLRKNVELNINLEEVANDYNVGYSYFRKMFKKYTGISPKQYLLQLKILRAKELLINSNLAVKEIAYELGFQSIYYFSRIFKEKTGMNPSELRRRHWPKKVNASQKVML